MASCRHLWMPPRRGGLPAKAKLMGERKMRVPGRGVVSFEVLEAQDPDHCWLMRWCLLCRDVHPDDAIERAKAVAS